MSRSLQPTYQEISSPDGLRESEPTRAETVDALLQEQQPLPGDILLFHHPERFRSKVICWFTHSPFYHVGLYAGEGMVIEARIPHVVQRDLRHQKDAFRFVVIHAPSRAAGLKALAWARDKVGAPYDLRSVALWVLGRIIHVPILCRCGTKEKYVCGNLVVQAFAQAGVDLFPGKCATEVAPADFAALLTSDVRAEESSQYPPNESSTLLPCSMPAMMDGAASAEAPQRFQRHEWHLLHR